MEYRVEVSDQADAELDAAYLFHLQKSPDSAIRWYLGAKTAIRSLSTFPRRCPPAREAASYPGQEVYQLLFGRRGSTYRILFVVFDEDAEVRVIRFRHGARHSGRQTQEDDD